MAKVYRNFFPLKEFDELREIATERAQNASVDPGMARKGLFLSNYRYVRPQDLVDTRISHLYNDPRVIKAVQCFAGCTVYPIQRNDLNNKKLNYYVGEDGERSSIGFHLDSPFRSGHGLISAVMTLSITDTSLEEPFATLECLNPQSWEIDPFRIYENCLSVHRGDTTLHRILPLTKTQSRIAFIMFYRSSPRPPKLYRRCIDATITSATASYLLIMIENPRNLGFEPIAWSVGFCLFCALLLNITRFGKLVKCKRNHRLVNI
jgi:hypothetical protein